MGQPPYYCSQIQCGEHLTSQGQSCMFKPTATDRWSRTPTKGPDWKQGTHLGPKQGENENQCTLKTGTEKRDNTNANNTTGNKKPYMVLPHEKGLIESMKNICNKHGVQVYYKGGNNIKGLLMAPKDKDHITKKSGIIYRFKCNRLDCDDEYIGESSRTFGERFKDHLKAPSPIYDHYNITGHSTTIENFSIVGREDQNLIRATKEAIYIRLNNPSLNKNIGKYHLPHIWDEVLMNISELKLK